MDSGLNGFFSQLPPIIPIVLFGSAFALFAVIAFFVWRRRVRAEKATGSGASVGFNTAPHMQADMRGSLGEMPDLDDLLAPTGAAPAVPVRVAAPVMGGSGTPGPNVPYTIRLADGSAVEAVETLVLLRDLIGGGLIARIGTTAHRLPLPPGEAEFARRLTALLRDAGRESTEPAAPSPAPSAPPANEAAFMRPAEQPRPPAPPAQPPSGSARPVVEDAMDTPLPEFDDIAPASPPAPPPPPAPVPVQPPAPPRPAMAAPPAPGDLPRFSLPSEPEAAPRFGRRPKKPTNEPIPEINIAGAIEAYLQHRIAQTPEWRGRSLHVSPAPGGGVTIEVDGRFYERVSEVEDAAARAFLQATIDEWQSRQ
jgi:hypothetical protein